MPASKDGIRPDNVPWLTPYLTVRDARASIDFYERAFGFELKDAVRDDDGTVLHTEMTYRGRLVVMFSPEGSYGNTMQAPATSGHNIPLNFYLYCEDVDAMVGRARDAGATVVMEPEDQFWGDRFGMVRDPDGYLWGFARVAQNPE